MSDMHTRTALITGASWFSANEYYRSLHMASLTGRGRYLTNLIMIDLNFEKLVSAQHSQDTNIEESLISEAIEAAQQCNAKSIAICSNTTSRSFQKFATDAVQIIDIIECVKSELESRNTKDVLLLGTMYTMEREFYRERIRQPNQIIHLPDLSDMQFTHRAIYDEFCKGVICQTTIDRFRSIIQNFLGSHTEGVVILGCTELFVLKRDLPEFSDSLIDSLSIHVNRILEHIR